MFSASLLAMMIHSLPPPAQGAFLGPADDTPGGPLDDRYEFDAEELGRRFRRVLPVWSPPWPRIPVVAHAVDLELFPRLENLAKISDGTADPNRGFIWGRIPLDHLIGHYLVAGPESADRENVDLGSPVRDVSGAGGTALPTACQTLLALTPSSGATIGAAIVDRGDPAPTPSGLPNTFGNKLRYAGNPTGFVLSSHAEHVLEVLLDRLNSHPAPRGLTRGGGPQSRQPTMLDITTVSMALMVSPTPNQVRGGRGCFAQHCAPELLTAIQNMNAHLNRDQLPAVINVSQGTHVGPHNGESPLEAYISGTLFRPNDRFLFAAAGNEGDAGISSRLDLRMGEADYMTVVAHEQCTDLLVEFWWDDATGPDVEIAVEISSTGFRSASIPINPKATGIAAVLKQPTRGRRPAITFLTLLKSNAQGSMSCIAFAATRPAAGPEFRASFAITAKSAPVAVQSWIVILDGDLKSHFTRGGPEGTVCAPASDPAVVSVAGYDAAQKQMWRDSSRGPASRYASATESPAMAHLVGFPGTANAPPGTSFASPRAAADAAVPLAVPTRRANCKDVTSLLVETYGSIGTWDARHGFHRQTT